MGATVLTAAKARRAKGRQCQADIHVKIRDKCPGQSNATAGGARGSDYYKARAAQSWELSRSATSMRRWRGADLTLDIRQLDTDPDSRDSTPSSAANLGPIDVPSTPASCPWGGLSTNQTRQPAESWTSTSTGVILDSAGGAAGGPARAGHQCPLAGEIYAVGVVTLLVPALWSRSPIRPGHRSAGVKFSMVLPSSVEPIAGAPIKGFKNAGRISPTRSCRADCSSQTAGAGHESASLDDRGTAVHAARLPRRACLHRRCSAQGPTRPGLVARRNRCAAPAGVDQRASELPCAGGACVVGQPGSCSGGNPDPRAQSKLTGIDKVTGNDACGYRQRPPVGDTVITRKLHGGDDQAVYAYVREDSRRVGKPSTAPSSRGMFGETHLTCRRDAPVRGTGGTLASAPTD